MKITKEQQARRVEVAKVKSALTDAIPVNVEITSILLALADMTREFTSLLIRMSLGDFLQLAFVRAVVAKDVPDGVKQWREAERISLNSFRMPLLPEEKVSYLKLNRELFNLAERPLTTQLNPYHPKATEIRNIRLSPNQDGWVAILSYGYDRSAWDYDLTNERSGFAQTVITAALRMKELVA